MTDYPFARLRALKCDYAHLVLVPVPAGKPQGDFSLAGARIANRGDPMFTFSGIAAYHPRVFDACPGGRWSVVPVLRKLADEDRLTGERYRGRWDDAVTQEKLAQLH